MTPTAPTIDAPAGDAWAVYDRSFARMLSTADAVNERVRQAFEAGYEAGRRAGDVAVDLVD